MYNIFVPHLPSHGVIARRLSRAPLRRIQVPFELPPDMFSATPKMWLGSVVAAY